MPVQQQPMAPMPFYADPNRFPTPVWQADPSQGWSQGQFIQQIPSTGQPIETYQQYPNGIYQATYQQPAFETNTFYTGAVQVLTNPRPPSVPNQQVLAPPRPSSNYSHTPSPSPAQQQQQQQTQQGSRQYQEYATIQQSQGNQQQQQQQQGYITATTPTASENGQNGANSRPGSVTTIINPPTPNQNFSQNQTQQSQQQQQGTFTTISNFSPNSSVNYVNASSGNAQPGYPQVNSSPQLASHSSSGYPGQQQHYGGQGQQWQSDDQLIWDHQQQQNHNQHQQTNMHQQQSQQHQQQPLDQHQDHQANHYLRKDADDRSTSGKMDEVQSTKTFSQADKVNLNTRIKTMILNKQQENKMDDTKTVEQNSTGHFLWYSHHHHLTNDLGVDGGFPVPDLDKLNTAKNVNPYYGYRNHVSQNYNHDKIAQKIKLEENTCASNQYEPVKKENTPFNKYDNIKLPLPLPKDVTLGDIKTEKNNFRPCDNSHFLPVLEQKIDINKHNGTNLNYSSTDKVSLPAFDGLPPSNDLQSKPLNGINSNKSKEKANLSKHTGLDIPSCNCFPPEQNPPEPGPYYTHLGCANNLNSLRYDLECRTGVKGEAIRIEKVRYTGKEGKTAQGCPIAKWVIRRQKVEEKYLVIVKHRKGHFCHSAFIVVCLVIWDGVERGSADELYSLLTEKLNKFGIPTKRRCATNEPRTCACQGINEETCGASYSFGCSWSMYYNGCKFARSKEVRKFRLTDKNEEVIVEEKLQSLANYLNPIYGNLAPRSFHNQIHFEDVASDCRLGYNRGRPFSGVTACMDFCAHSHKDLHNMINGCTVVVSLTKHRGLSKPQDEQLHVLPMYVADDTDEFDSKENQELKTKNGAIDVLHKFPSEVRTCSVPAETCLRRNRKGQEGKKAKRKLSKTQLSPVSSQSHSQENNVEIQNGHVSSTVLDYPKNTWRYDNYSNNSLYQYPNEPVTVFNSNDSYPPSPRPTFPHFSFFKTPYSPIDNYPFSNHYSQNGYLRDNYYGMQSYYYNYPNAYPSPFHLGSFPYPPYNVKNPFDDYYQNNTLPNGDAAVKDGKQKVVDVTYTDNEECFRDPDIGGVAIALQHGSVLFECAKHELHATTALKKPNRLSPTRISLVFYQHRNMNNAQHGLDEYAEKMKRKLDPNSSQSDLDKSGSVDLDSSFGSLSSNRGDIIMKTPTLPTVSLTTMFPMYPCIVTGPFQEQLPCTLGEKT